MSDIINADICIIGAGSGGLSVAAGAAQLGAKTVLLEKGKMGGDCLNYGCVPSKAILAAGHAAHTMRTSAPFGIAPVEPQIDFAGVHKHVHDVIGEIAPNDSVERFTSLGVQVIEEAGEFIDEATVKTDNHVIKARRFVIATGSSASIIPIPGLSDVPFLTNETLFDLTERPEHLLIIGGGPIGLEMAQAFRQLGSEVSVMALGFMEQSDPELAAIQLDRLKEEGIRLEGGISIKSVEKNGDVYSVTYERNGQTETLSGSHLLVATGRSPNVGGLNLEAAGIEYDRGGIKTGLSLRTTNKRVYAIGDVAGGLQFTHRAGYDAGILIRRLMFGMFWAKADYSALPKVTYTNPELAEVGLTEAQAREKYGDKINIARWPYLENDRAQAERQTDGLIKIITDKKGRILGVGIVGHLAGELLQPWVLALTKKMKIGDMTGFIAPYPTFGEISKRAAGSYFTPSLFSDKTRKLVKILSKLG